MTARIWRAVATVLVAAALAACGGGGDDSEPPASTTTTEAALSRDQFVAQANRICANTRVVLEDLQVVLQGLTDRAQIAQLLADRLIPALRDQADALDALEAPEAFADEIDDILAQVRERLGPIEADPVGQLLEADDDPFGDLNERLSGLGLTVCAGEG